MERIALHKSQCETSNTNMTSGYEKIFAEALARQGRVVDSLNLSESLTAGQ